MKRTLKVFLKKNELTEDPSDYTGVVSSLPSIGKKEILDEIIADGIEVSRSTIDACVTRYVEKAVDKALSGHNVNLGFIYMRSVIKGALYGKTWNPEVNRVEMSVTTGADSRKAAAETNVEILGVASDMIEIYSITDNVTGATDGTLTKGRNAELKGSYIKVVGDKPEVGVTFRNLATSAVTNLAAADIVINEPSRLMLFVPASLIAGEYELTVTTQYTGGNKLLKDVRSATLGIPVVIA